MARKSSNQLRLGDESVFGNTSEVIWSRASGDLFTDDDYDCVYRISDSDETHSYSSWGFSNYEKRSVQKISSYLEAIDAALYEDKFSSLDIELTTECQKWKEAFPHLRLKGVNIATEVECKEHPNQQECDTKSSVSPKHGFKSPRNEAHIPSLCYHSGDGNHLLNSGYDQVEEVIETDGIYEESYPSGIRTNSCDESCAFTSEKTPSAFSYYYVKGKIIEFLADIVWKNVTSTCSNSTNVIDAKESERLPPIVSPQEPFVFRNQGPIKAKGWNNLASDFPKLDGVLVVSPKVLLPKNERPGTRTSDSNSRPNTGWSSFSETTRSLNSQHSSAQRHIKTSAKNKHNLLDHSDTKVTEKDLELIRMYLPTVEENNPVLQNGLQGLHIQPELKRSIKLISYDSSNPLAKPPTFLPPIEDKDARVSPNKNFQHSHHESHKKKDVNQNSCMIYARHLNKTGSRPSTSQTEDFSVTGLSRMKRPDSSNLSSFVRKQSSIPSTAPVGNNIVNIFPIVTSLEPKQSTKRKPTAQRKGMLSAICRDKR